MRFGKKYICKLNSVAMYIISFVILQQMLMFAVYDSLLIPIHPLFDISFVVIVSSIMFLCPKKGAVAVGAFFIVLQACLNITAITIYNNTGLVFHFSLIALGGMVAPDVTPDMFPFLSIVIMVLVLSVYIMETCLINHFVKDKPSALDDKKKYSRMGLFVKRLGIIVPVFFISLFGLLFGFYGTFLKDDTVGTEFEILGDREAYLRFSSPESDLQKFGVWGYYINDLFRWAFKIKYVPKYKALEVDTVDPFDAGELLGMAEGNNLLYIVAESFDSYLISEELTPVLYGLKNGYNFTEENFYDIYDFTLDTDRTNNLVRKDYNFTKSPYNYVKKQDAPNVLNENEFYKYGISLTNFYNAQPTNISEFEFFMTALPSYMTEVGNIAEEDIVNIHPETSLSYILKKSGRVNNTLYAHRNGGNFYGRSLLIGKLEYDEIYFDNGEDKAASLSNNSTRTNLDSEFDIDKLLHPDLEGGNWYSQYLTITTHGGYAGNLINGDGANHPQEFANYYAFVDAWRDAIKTNVLEDNAYNSLEDYAFPGNLLMPNFYARALDTEYFMARVIDGLIQTKQLDNTVIIFAADHQSFMHGIDINYKKFFYEEPIYDYSSDKRELEAFMWGKCLNFGTEQEPENLYIDKFVTRTDFMPTILTLFGIEYDYSYFVGRVFTDTVETACVYSGVGIFNDKYFTLDGRTILLYNSSGQLLQVDGFYSEDEGIKSFLMSVINYINKRRYIDTKLSQINKDTQIIYPLP